MVRNQLMALLANVNNYKLQSSAIELRVSQSAQQIDKLLSQIKQCIAPLSQHLQKTLLSIDKLLAQYQEEPSPTQQKQVDASCNSPEKQVPSSEQLPKIGRKLFATTRKVSNFHGLSSDPSQGPKQIKSKELKQQAVEEEAGEDSEATDVDADTKQ